MDPSKWGPSFWDTLFNIAVNYRKENKDEVQVTIMGILQSLPCKSCRDSTMHFVRNDLPHIQTYMRSREDLLRWLYNLKHLVNLKLGKQSPPFETVRKFWLCQHKGWVNVPEGPTMNISRFYNK